MCAFFAAATVAAQTYHPVIPRAWNDQEVASTEVPLAQPDRSPRYLTSEEYYALQVRPVYRTYPFYAPAKEPPGYLETLKQKEPEILFDPAELRTQQDWIRVGELVFDSPTVFVPISFLDVQNEEIRAAGYPITRDGIVPYFRYIIRKKGTVEIGPGACGMCHTRVLPDGTVWKGAQGNIPQARALAWNIHRRAALSPGLEARQRNIERMKFAAPWTSKMDEFEGLTIGEITRRYAAMQPGVLPRQGTSLTHPTKTPALIGVKDLKYLDATGLSRHRSAGDLMRYSIINQGLDLIAHYGDFQPSPTQATRSDAGTRYSDEQLYALTLYLYSLKAPPNPNLFDERARHGQEIFQQQGCNGCHTPPLYTNNKLTPALGFHVPEELRKTDDILDLSVATDPTLAMKTPRSEGTL